MSLTKTLKKLVPNELTLGVNSTAPYIESKNKKKREMEKSKRLVAEEDKIVTMIRLAKNAMD